MRYCVVVTFEHARAVIVFGPFQASTEEYVMGKMRERFPGRLIYWEPMRETVDA